MVTVATVPIFRCCRVAVFGRRHHSRAWTTLVVVTVSVRTTAARGLGGGAARGTRRTDVRTAFDCEINVFVVLPLVPPLQKDVVRIVPVDFFQNVAAPIGWISLRYFGETCAIQRRLARHI